MAVTGTEWNVAQTFRVQIALGDKRPSTVRPCTARLVQSKAQGGRKTPQGYVQTVCGRGAELRVIFTAHSFFGTTSQMYTGNSLYGNK